MWVKVKKPGDFWKTSFNKIFEFEVLLFWCALIMLFGIQNVFKHCSIFKMTKLWRKQKFLRFYRRQQINAKYKMFRICFSFLWRKHIETIFEGLNPPPPGGRGCKGESNWPTFNEMKNKNLDNYRYHKIIERGKFYLLSNL